MSGRHGTHVAYVQDRCRCDACRQANRDYERARTRRRAEEAWGVRPPAMVDSGPARDHIAALHAAGMGTRTIAAASGVGCTVIARLSGWDQSRPAARVRRETEARILAVQPTLDLLAGGARVDAGPWRRRIQALVAIGHTQTWIAGQCGVALANLGKQLHYGDTITAGTARTWRDLYQQWHMTPGPSARARQIAARYGWAPPLAWDDIDAGILAATERRRRRAAS